MGATDVVSVDFLTNAWIDWSDFCGSFGVTGGRFLSMITSATQDGRYTRHLGFGLH
jgi:hypothetical protein